MVVVWLVCRSFILTYGCCSAEHDVPFMQHFYLYKWKQLTNMRVALACVPSTRDRTQPLLDSSELWVSHNLCEKKTAHYTNEYVRAYILRRFRFALLTSRAVLLHGSLAEAYKVEINLDSNWNEFIKFLKLNYDIGEVQRLILLIDFIASL